MRSDEHRLMDQKGCGAGLWCQEQLRGLLQGGGKALRSAYSPFQIPLVGDLQDGESHRVGEVESVWTDLQNQSTRLAREASLPKPHMSDLTKLCWWPYPPLVPVWVAPSTPKGGGL